MLIISTSSLYGYGIHRIFSIVKKAGFTGIDLSLREVNYDLWDPDYILSLVEEYNIPVLSITAPTKGMTSEKLDKIIILATKLKSQIITFTPPHHNDKEDSWFKINLLKIKQEYSIGLCIKNVEPKMVMVFIPEYKNASITEISSITGSTTFDISSIGNENGMDITNAYNILGASIKNILLSDKSITKKGLVPGTLPGLTSNLPLESFLIRLKTSSYNGFITLDVDPIELGVGQEELVLQNLEKFKAYYKKYYLD